MDEIVGDVYSIIYSVPMGNVIKLKSYLLKSWKDLIWIAPNEIGGYNNIISSTTPNGVE